MTEAELDRLLESNRARLLALPGVVGVGIGLCDAGPCIHVYVARAAPGTGARVKEILGPAPVEIIVSGEFRPLGD